MPIQPIERKNISDQITAQLRERITDGTWKPGDRLPGENELAEQFGVSRVTVRNAIQKLAGQGLLETRMGEGSFVRRVTLDSVVQQLLPILSMSPDGLREILQFRVVIEGPVCGLACRFATEEELDALSRLYEEMCACPQPDEYFAELDHRFHLELVTMTHNDLLKGIYTSMQEVLRQSFRQAVSVRGPAAGLHFHGLILAALRNRDSAEARHLMELHMEEMYRSFFPGDSAL